MADDLGQNTSARHLEFDLRDELGPLDEGAPGEPTRFEHPLVELE